MPPPITLTSPLGDALKFESMTYRSGLSELGQMQLGLLGTRDNFNPDDLLGQKIKVHVPLGEGTERIFSGYVTNFGMGAPRGGHHGYHAVVRPWLWFLTRTTDCRIFQTQTVPDIVKQVFEEHAVANFEFKLFRKYRTWNYCVQYRESDFNFVARLLEHEGIYWYFEHTDAGHKLVLVDSLNAHDVGNGCERLPFNGSRAEVRHGNDCVTDWRFEREVRPGRVALTSYDFTRPTTDLGVGTSIERGYQVNELERFDFQGDYVLSDDGHQWAGDRLDALQVGYEQGRGQSNAVGLACGHVFTLADHPRTDQNDKYLVTSTEVHAHQPTGDMGGEHGYSVAFSALRAAQQFRPLRRTAKPEMKGPQTAVVVGPEGEEIFTDEYGRVRVQFHWDRYGQHSEKSSCWVRVSQVWAGKSFGFIQLPRIGHEVVVDFLEGDPDQPIVTGRVYNADNMPPWELPANATQSGVLTRSSKGGAYGNANAIRFEDKAGSEQLLIHAEKNQDIEVENDETHWVGHDRKKTVDNDETTHVKHDRTETVDNNETIKIGVDRTEEVGSNEKIKIGANRTEDVAADEKITIGANRTVKVGADEKVTISGSRTDNVTGDATETIMGALKQTVMGTVTQTVVGSLTQTVNGAINVTTPAAMTVMAAGGFTVVAPGGTRTVDSFFDQVGMSTSSAFATSMTATGSALSVFGLNSQHQVIGSGWTGFKNELVNCVFSHTGVKMDTATLDMSSGGVEFKFKSLFFVA